MQEGEKRKLHTSIITSLLVFVIIIALFIAFFTIIKQRLYMTSTSFVMQSAEQNAKRIDRLINSDISNLSALAHLLGAQKEFNLEESLKLIYAENERNRFIVMGLIMPDGTGYLNNLPVMDYANEEFFKKALDGVTLLSDSFHIADIVPEVNAYGVPVLHQNKLVGVLVALIDNSDFKAELETNAFNGEMYAFIIDKEGEDIALSNHKNAAYKGGNFFDFIEEGSDENNTDKKAQKEDFLMEKSGVLEYYKDEGHRYACYIPLESRPEWYVISVVLKEEVTKESDYITHLTLGFCVIVTIFYFITSIFNIQRQRKDALHMEKMIETKAQNERDLQIAKETQRAKNQFFANVSHEIKTPLNVVVGLIHLLQKTDMNEKQEDYANKIGNASDSLLRIVSDMLELSNISEDTIKLKAEEINLNETILSIYDIFSIRASHKGVSLKLSFSNEDNMVVKSDKIMFHQAISSLLSTVISKTEKGQILYIDVKTVDDTVDTVKILMDIHADIYEEEAGIGITLSREIIERLGGNISIIQKDINRSIFRIELTLEKCESEALPGTLEEQKTAVEGKRVLIVEDSATNREIEKVLLEEMGLICDTANDGMEGLEICRSKPNDYYDLILTDIHMPRMDGYEMSRALKQILHVEAVIVVLTATIVDASVREENADIIYSYLLKPINPSDLEKRIKRVLIQKYKGTV